MKIATASSAILSSDVRKDAAKSLAAGEQVFVSTSAEEAEVVRAALRSPDLTRQIEAAAVTGIRIDDGWNVPGLVIGTTGGTIVGAGIGVLLDQLRAVHPQSAVAFEAACAVIGAGIGGVVGSKKVKLKFEAYGVKLDLE